MKDRLELLKHVFIAWHGRRNPQAVWIGRLLLGLSAGMLAFSLLLMGLMGFVK